MGGVRKFKTMMMVTVTLNQVRLTMKQQSLLQLIHQGRGRGSSLLSYLRVLLRLEKLGTALEIIIETAHGRHGIVQRKPIKMVPEIIARREKAGEGLRKVLI